ncbi:hypothetical protein K449DRAFT_438660 [Hypoxylon sp. EC38]|nr:hypothetical protein K449DRAFT_438660 [Hypoxylon sp. EC38]
MSSQAGPDGNPWDKEKKHKFENKSKSEYFDPCQEAAARSIRCLNRNGGDRQMCTDYFDWCTANGRVKTTMDVIWALTR